MGPMAWKRNSRRRSELPANWNQIRSQALRRDGGMCVFCGETATDVDHIQPGGDHSLENLRSLCRRCHMARTARQSHQSRHENKGKPFQYKHTGRPHRPSTGHPGLVE